MLKPLNVFVVAGKGRYKIRYFIHNVFPKAMFYDDNARSAASRRPWASVSSFQSVSLTVSDRRNGIPETTIEVKSGA